MIDKYGNGDATIEEIAKRIISDLSEDQVEALTESFAESETIDSIPLDVSSDETSGTKVRLWLHVRQTRKCWYVKARHEYEAYVTEGSKDGPRYTVDKIDLRIMRDKDGADYTHTCKDTSWCPKTDKLFGTFNICGWSKVKATATQWGQSWSTNWSTIN